MKFEIFKNKTQEIMDDYVIITYDLESTESLEKAAWDLAIGQSVGNPNVRNKWETDELFENYSAIIIDDKERLRGLKRGLVEIGFPIVNTNWEEDGISHLVCQMMGGQVDIDHIIRCRAVDIVIPQEVQSMFFKKPAYGLSGMRKFTGVYDKPFLGGIVKPKTGISPKVLLEMVKQLVDGGVNFIKEDEILASPGFCRLEDRVELISNYLAKSAGNVVYSFCINGDPLTVLKKARFVAWNGGNSVHANIWCGLGVYNSLRKLNLPLFIHYQKSGDKAITHQDNRYGISWDVLCKLAVLCGVDTIHAGMFGGYLNDDEATLRKTMQILTDGNVVPALSCGMHPGIVNYVTDTLGCDYMANVGGAIHGHPLGTVSGARAMRQAIDKDFSLEYDMAIAKWGKK